MTVVIDDPELDVKVTELAAAYGVPVEKVLREALSAGMERMRPGGATHGAKQGKPTVEEALALIASFPKGKIDDQRSEAEILGYGPNGYCE